MPVLLSVRIFRRLAAQLHSPMLLLRCAPLIGIFVLAWSWGEFVGYWSGPGDAMQRVC
jgi:hypothetical protein